MCTGPRRRDVFCSLDGKNKSYCTPEAYRGDTCWLYHNRGNGTFEDVTATSGIFDSSSKSLGVAMLDYDQDGWPDLLVANDTQPNKLYRNLHNGKFKDVAVEAGLAFSEEGKARAGMGVDVADFDNSGKPGIVITNFDNEMIGLYRATGQGLRRCGHANRPGRGFAEHPGFWLRFFRRRPGRAAGYRRRQRPHRRNGAQHSRQCRLRATRATLPESRRRKIPRCGRRSRRRIRPAQSRARPGVGDFDRDGDLDLLLTTNNGPAYLYRNDQLAGNSSIRFHLVGTKSNRDAIGANVRVYFNGQVQSRVVRSGSSYLSQSELPVTFGVGKQDVIDRVVVEWPSGAKPGTPQTARPERPTKSLKIKVLRKYFTSNFSHYCQAFRSRLYKRSNIAIASQVWLSLRRHRKHPNKDFAAGDTTSGRIF